MEKQTNILIIKPKKANAYYSIFYLLGLSLFTYYIFTENPENTNHLVNVTSLVFLWIILIVVGIVHLYYSITCKSPVSKLSLKLTPEGFYDGNILYRWYEIEYFGVKRKPYPLFSFQRVVYWKYRSASANHQLTNNMTRFFSGYDDALAREYELAPDALANLLNEWKAKHTGHFTEIITDMRPARR